MQESMRTEDIVKRLRLLSIGPRDAYCDAADRLETILKAAEAYNSSRIGVIKAARLHALLRAITGETE